MGGLLLALNPEAFDRGLLGDVIMGRDVPQRDFGLPPAVFGGLGSLDEFLKLREKNIGPAMPPSSFTEESQRSGLFGRQFRIPEVARSPGDFLATPFPPSQSMTMEGAQRFFGGAIPSISAREQYYFDYEDGRIKVNPYFLPTALGQGI